MAGTTLPHPAPTGAPSTVGGDDKTWQRCLRALEGRLPRHAFEICLRGSQARPTGPRRMEIVLGNRIALDMMRRMPQQDVEAATRDVLAEIMGEAWDLEWRLPSVSVAPPAPSGPSEGISVPPPRSAPAPSRASQPRAEKPHEDAFTFETFVIGASNQMAAQAARQVAENPGAGFNPLVLYGEVGLGKTHLMRAVEHLARRVRPTVRVAMASSEAFTNELIDAFENHRAGAFRRKYRQVDLLLVDDVEFLIGKERIQEEFYHTFEEVANRGGQVVLTSDRPPHLLTNLQGRLCSRLSSGLIADIQPPDLQTRMAILRRKARGIGLVLEDEVVRYAGEGFVGNVRQLEGALKRLHAYAQAQGTTRIDMGLATRALDGIRTASGRPLLTVSDILQKVAEYFQVSISDLVGSRRDRRISRPRHLAMFLATRLTSSRGREVAEVFGGKDYSTVIHAVRKVEGQQDDATTRTDLRNLYALLGHELQG